MVDPANDGLSRFATYQYCYLIYQWCCSKGPTDERWNNNDTDCNI